MLNFQSWDLGFFLAGKVASYHTSTINEMGIRKTR